MFNPFATLNYLCQRDMNKKTVNLGDRALMQHKFELVCFGWINIDWNQKVEEDSSITSDTLQRATEPSVSITVIGFGLMTQK